MPHPLASPLGSRSEISTKETIDSPSSAVELRTMPRYDDRRGGGEGGGGGSSEISPHNSVKWEFCSAQFCIARLATCIL